MSNPGPLSPSQSPARFQAQAGGTRRVNNRPVLIACFVAFGIVALIFYAAFAVRRAQAPQSPDDAHGQRVTTPAAFRGPAGVVVTRAASAAMATSSAVTSTPQPTATPDEVAKARLAAFLAALKAPAGVQVDASRVFAPKPKASMAPQQVAMLERQDPNNARSALAAYQSGPSGRYSPAEAGAAVPLGDDADGNTDRWLLHSTLQTPKSPYVLQPTSLIPATLISAVVSELPGMIKAQVSEDVYDTPSGQYLLIPKGSILVGQYQSKVEYGQGRLFIAFNRLQYPDPPGRWLDLGAMPGVADDGSSGGHDEVDTHFFRTFGHALLMSVITAGVTLSQPQYGYSPSSGVSASSALSEALGQNLGSAMAELFHKDINVAPTLRLRNGFQFSVMVSKDIYFPGPYQRPNYTLTYQTEGK